MTARSLGHSLTIVMFCLLTTACTGPAPIGAPSNPVFIVAYSPNTQVRSGFEAQLASDLQTRGIANVQSRTALPEFQVVTYPTVLKAARDARAGLILMVRRLISDAPVDSEHQPVGIDRHRTLSAYFASTDRNRLPTIPPPGRQVIEVDAYQTDTGSNPQLVWHGFSWVDFSGDLEAAIRDTAEIIATNMAAAQPAIDTR